LDATGKGAITVPAGLNPFAFAAFGLPAGSDTITFSYSGDPKYQPAKSTFTQFVNKADTATTAAVHGSDQPLRLSATVSINESSVANSIFALPGNLSSCEPTGTVQFFDGTTLLGTATLASSGLFSSTATLAAVTVPASLTAVYKGDGNYNGSTSAAVVGTGKGTANLSVTSSANPSTVAQPVTFSVAVTPATGGGAVPTGTVLASLLGLYNLGGVTLDGTGKGSITVPAAANTASIPWGLPAGSNSVTFSYSGDSQYSSGQTTLTQTVNQAATATAATVSAGDTTITATVSIDEPSVSSIAFALPGPNAAIGNPTGSVQFMNGSTPIGKAPLAPNGHFQSVATLTVTQPFSSSTDLTAVYNGDANYTGSTSPPATVPTLGTVTVGIASSVNPATFAEPVTLSIKVAPKVSGSLIPTGTVQATVPGSDILGSATLDNTGSATITVPSQLPSASPALPWGLATGSNAITVTYSGDSNFAAGQSTLNQSVIPANSSTTILLTPGAIIGNQTALYAKVSIDEASVSQTGFRIPAPGNLSTSPTGTLQFFEGATLLGTANVTPGSLFESTATITTTIPTGPVRAVYSGDTNYNGSSSPGTTTGNGTVGVTLTSSVSPTTYGAAFTVLAEVVPAASGGPTPTGTVQFFDGSQNLNWIATLDGQGHATLPIPLPLATPLLAPLYCDPGCASNNVMVLGAGSHVITAQYSGDVNYAAATSATPVTEKITKAPTTTALSGFTTVLDPPVASGLTAIVADAQPPTGGPYHFLLMGSSGLVDGNPSGTVTFDSGTTSIGTGTLAPNFSGNVSSSASLTAASITGTSFSATYPGDANFQGSSSPTPAPTSVSLTGNPNPSNTGQSVTLTATVSSASATPGPTGRVVFLDGTTLLGNAPVSGGMATLLVSFTNAGSHSLTATYSGDENYSPSTSAAYIQTVNGSTSPTDTLKLTISNTTAVYGQHIVLFAQVTGNVSAPPTGTVNFLDGTTTIATGTLSQNSTYVLVTLAVGKHQISATWAGDSNWPAAQSAVIAVTVGMANSITNLTNFGNAWTAVVMAEPPGEGTPTGSVQFVDMVTQAVLATATLSDGVATATLTSVTDPVQAVYSGDTNFEPSKSRPNSTHPTAPKR
jgi:hypothetical protein